MKRRAAAFVSDGCRRASWGVFYERRLRQWGLVGGAGDVENLEGFAEILVAEVGGFRFAASCKGELVRRG